MLQVFQGRGEHTSCSGHGRTHNFSRTLFRPHNCMRTLRKMLRIARMYYTWRFTDFGLTCKYVLPPALYSCSNTALQDSLSCNHTKSCVTCGVCLRLGSHRPCQHPDIQAQLQIQSVREKHPPRFVYMPRYKSHQCDTARKSYCK